MKPHINPIIDCVFKAVLGSDENKNLLINFLNAVLNTQEDERIVDVEIINPYSVKEFPKDKQFIVDVKAKGENDEIFQVEMQLTIFPTLRKRMQYTFFDLYAQQIQSGDDYSKLQPTISIWMLTENLVDPEETDQKATKNDFHRTYTMYDKEHQDILVEGCSLHVLEFPKWEQQKTMDDLDIWIRFFREGKEYDDEDLPDGMKTDEVIQAMKTLRRISEKEEEYHLYQSRMDAIRERNAIQSDITAAIEGERKAIERERQALELASKTQKENEQLQKEIERLKKRYGDR